MTFLRRTFLILFLFTLGVNSAYADGAFYLVRHAEKQQDGTKNPHLTERGVERAEYLAQQLSSIELTRIYSTDYHRTLETAEPLSELLDIPIKLYNPRELEQFAKALKKETGQVLIVGHSNTTPELTALLSDETVEPMDETEYDNLYQVVLMGDKAQLNRFKIFPIDSNR